MPRYSKAGFRLGAVFTTYTFNFLDTGKVFPSGDFTLANGAREVQEQSGGLLKLVQLPVFPGQVSDENFPVTEMLFNQLLAVDGLEEVIPIAMMLNDPMDPKFKEDNIDTLANGGIKFGKLGATLGSSTSLEAWFDGFNNRAGVAYTGDELKEKVRLLIDIHVAAARRILDANCGIKAWNIEFLRTVEYTTFTNIRKAWDVIAEINDNLGEKFYKLLDDGAHGKDSGLDLTEQNNVRKEACDAGAYGIMHVSNPTDRGRITEAGLKVIEYGIRHGCPSDILVEIFDPEDPILADMVKNIDGFGKKTFEDPSEVIADALMMTNARLDQFVADGLIDA